MEQTANEHYLHSIPSWMKLDTRPMDKGVFQKYGYGYSREVGKQELWRPATRVILRKDKKFCNYKMVDLYPGAYYVSDHGRAWSCLTNQIISKRRYHRRHNKLDLLAADGSRVQARRYKLVLDNFIEPPARWRNFVYYLLNTINHRDGRSWNDHTDNLQYCSRAANVEHQKNEIMPFQKKRQKQRKDAHD